VGERLSRAINRAQERDEGFTLIELLVVIVILGILAAVVVFSVGGIGDKGQKSANTIDVRTMRTAEEAYFGKFGHYGTEAQLLHPEDGGGGLIADLSSKHDVLLLGDAGPAQTFRITCPVAQPSCGADTATPVGGKIRVAGGTDVTTPGAWLNPAVSSGGGIHPNVEYMFNGLMRWADNNTSQPDLAQSYTISPDQKTATFTLRSGMTWHNGGAITPADVKFTFEQALLKFHGRTSASMGPALGVTGVGAAATTPVGAITTTATDVVFHFTYSYAPLLKQMNVTEAPIIPEAVYGACAYAPYPGGAGNIDAAGCGGNNPGAGDNPAVTTVGSGPFVLKNRNTATGALVFVKFANYHFAGLPLADEVDQVPTANAANALVANSIDVGSPSNDRVLPIVAPQLTADITPANGYTLTQPPRGTGGGNCILTESFNLWKRGDTPATINAKAANAPYEHPIFGDPTIVPANAAAGRPNPMQRGLVVRTALAMGVDRQNLFNANQFGKGKLATSPYHSAVPGYSPVGVPALDATKAGQWLTDAGWIDTGAVRTSDHAFGTVAIGAPLAFEMIAGTGSQVTYGNGIKTSWAAAPIKANMTVTGQANGTISNSRFGDRQFDMITVSYCNGDDPVIGVRRQYYAGTSVGATASSQISATGFTNAAGYRTTTMDALWDQAAQSSSPATHAAIQAEAAANVPYIWLDESLGSRAWKTSKCSGFNNNNTGLFVETASCAP
jgi:peptide/nickel transport system substrate-binding protein